MLAPEHRPPLPHNIEAEQALLGAILVNNEVLHRVSDLLEPEHFFEPIHQQIYDVARSLIRAGRLATPVTLKSFLPAELDVAGLTLGRYLSRLCAEATTVINAPDYARDILDLHGRRVMIGIADDLRDVSLDAPVDMTAATVASHAIEQLDAIVSARSANYTPARSFSEAMSEMVENMTAAYQRDGAPTGIPSGLRSLDHKLCGLQRGDLIILAGRPGMGKTALALGIALRAASAGNPALFFSQEMSARQLADRGAADLLFNDRPNDPTYWQIAGGHLDEEQAQRVVEAARGIADTVPMRIEQQPALNISQIAARARKHTAKLEREGKTLALLVVDHLGLIIPGNVYRGNRTNEIGEITAALKTLAKELNVALIALCQLNRGVETRDNKRPGLSDLRDSGTIEQDADVILLAYREEYYLANAKSNDKAEEDRRIARLFEVRNRLELILAKNRNGPTDIIDLFFSAAHNAARDLERQGCGR
jgi:replicative DNA helicase